MYNTIPHSLTHAHTLCLCLSLTQGHEGLPLTFLLDLVEVADLLGARNLHIMLDLRQHGTQSLLHPGLARFQGEAARAWGRGLGLGHAHVPRVL